MVELIRARGVELSKMKEKNIPGFEKLTISGKKSGKIHDKHEVSREILIWEWGPIFVVGGGVGGVDL